MNGENFTILNRYSLHEGADPNGKLLHRMSEQQLLGWLRNRGFLDPEATEIITRIAVEGKATITMP
jgi:hypothetical protein